MRITSIRVFLFRPINNLLSEILNSDKYWGKNATTNIFVLRRHAFGSRAFRHLTAILSQMRSEDLHRATHARFGATLFNTPARGSHRRRGIVVAKFVP